MTADWSEDFVDISTLATPRYRTRFKGLWSPWGLHVFAELDEPHLWATLSDRDSVIFQDNDFELFLDPDGDHCNYLEVEVNALNTVWDLLLVKPYRAGGPALTGYDLKGLETRVELLGSLNDPSDVDSGWRVWIDLPWFGLAELAGTACPPNDGDRWKVNFSRVQWELEQSPSGYSKVPGRPESNWVWSPQGVIDMHRPWNWGEWVFLKTGDSAAVSDSHPIRMRLVAAYEAQRAFHELNGCYAYELPGFDDMAFVAGRHVFEARYRGFAIDQGSCFWAE